MNPAFFYRALTKVVFTGVGCAIVAAIFAVCGQLILAESTLSAQDDIDNTVSRLTHTLMSPYCPGMTIDACPSDKARELRDEIRELAQKGSTAQEIEGILGARFGDKIRAAPNSYLLWMVPGFFFLLGLLIILTKTSRAYSRAESVSIEGESVDDND